MSQQFYASAAFHFCCNILWQSVNSGERYTCDRWMLCAVTTAVLHSSLVVLSGTFPVKCVCVPLMALPLLYLLPVCGALTGHSQQQSAKCSPPLTACWRLHLSGVLCVLNYGTKTPNTRFTANPSSYTCGGVWPFKTTAIIMYTQKLLYKECINIKPKPPTVSLHTVVFPIRLLILNWKHDKEVLSFLCCDHCLKDNACGAEMSIFID